MLVCRTTALLHTSPLPPPPSPFHSKFRNNRLGETARADDSKMEDPCREQTPRAKSGPTPFAQRADEAKLAPGGGTSLAIVYRLGVVVASLAFLTSPRGL